MLPETALNDEERTVLEDYLLNDRSLPHQLGMHRQEALDHARHHEFRHFKTVNWETIKTHLETRGLRLFPE